MLFIIWGRKKDKYNFLKYSLIASEWNRVQGPPSVEEFCHRLRRWMERILVKIYNLTMLMRQVCKIPLLNRCSLICRQP